MDNTIIARTANIFNHALDDFGIKYEMIPRFNGYQWLFPEHPGIDVIAHSASYGIKDMYVESFGAPWDNGDVTALTPYEMASRLAGYDWNDEDKYQPTVEDLYDSLFMMIGQ